MRFGASGLALLGAVACRAVPAEAAQNVSVRDFGARGDGRSDDTAAFQRGCDALRGGGVLTVPAGVFLVDRVAIRNRGILIALSPDTVLRKLGPAGPESRGIFVLDGLQRAGFELRGGTIDLNGEGPEGIGVAGRIRNRYASLTIPTVIGIAGPANAAVFARRSSGLTISGCRIVNSGENGLLFRNCGQVTVRDCDFANLANYGIEFSFLSAGGDGGSGPMPRRDDVSIVHCRFEGIDDYALGSGNGGGIGGGGAERFLGRFANYAIADCTFTRCHRDIHFEFQEGSWIERLSIARVTSIEPRQASIGLVGVRDSLIEDVSVTNPGSAPSALLIPARPEICGLILSTGVIGATLRNVRVIDDRPSRQLGGGGAAIARGSRRLTLTQPLLESADAGRWIGILGANPSGTAYVARIARVISPREAELTLPAGTGVRSARFAVGGVTRNGIILTASQDIAFDNVTVEAGRAADRASQTDAAALRMWRMRGRVSFAATRLRAPVAAASKPVGMRVSDTSAQLLGLEGVAIEGFERRVERR